MCQPTSCSKTNFETRSVYTLDILGLFDKLHQLFQKLMLLRNKAY